MRFTTFLRALVVILVVTFVTIFFIQNTGPAIIQFPFTRPRHFALIYILLIAYALGVLTAFSVAVVVNTRMRKKRKLMESEELIDEE